MHLGHNGDRYWYKFLLWTFSCSNPKSRFWTGKILHLALLNRSRKGSLNKILSSTAATISRPVVQQLPYSRLYLNIGQKLLQWSGLSLDRPSINLTKSCIVHKNITAKRIWKRCCCGMLCPIMYLRKISFFQIHFCHFDRDKELFLFFVKMKSKPRPLQKASCVKCLHEDSYSNLFIKSNINTVSNSRDNSVCFTKYLPQCFWS